MDSADLTARARIRDVAIVLFGQNGFAETTVRAIAAQADVSPGLVIHHFGGKDELRRDCDDRVVEFLRTKREAAENATGELLQHLGEYGLYLARMISDGTTAGNDLFDRLVAESEAMVVASIADGSMRKFADPQTLAIVLTMQSLAPLVLHAQLARHRGGGPLSAESLSAIALVTAEIYRRGLFTTDDLMDAVDQVARR